MWLCIFSLISLQILSPGSLCTIQINLATTSAAQLISRSQSVSSPSATTLTQSVLLGNTTSPPLNQSQAQMYLRVRHSHSHHCPGGIVHNLSSLAKNGSILCIFVVLAGSPGQVLCPWANPQAFFYLVGLGGPWTLQSQVPGWLKMAVNVAFRDTRDRVAHNMGCVCECVSRGSGSQALFSGAD